ncbi:GIY-YIG nuclease family protein [Desulfovibrio ferrophilus]|uniref:Bacteriophage T5 Orf172 DNA-binding domain-containing protein n=1 Tax=Desulfovibrio ferrophilus TaxID=241368 RepID=A0A2Z6B1W6_9BACT|nr:GIY-YIG nuclease family protein [Desulfovibrio ferrophilus]BBD09492.1 putative uncharacterized protein [Desulfovibrio ferrophilus]
MAKNKHSPQKSICAPQDGALSDPNPCNWAISRANADRKNRNKTDNKKEIKKYNPLDDPSPANWKIARNGQLIQTHNKNVNDLGFVYVLSNSLLQRNLIKIGKTNRSINKRISELQTTGVPGKFKLEFALETANCSIVEREVHKELSEYLVSKEFFKIDIDTAEETIREVSKKQSEIST